MSTDIDPVRFGRLSSKADGVRWTAIADLDPAKAERFVDSLAKVITADEVEAVYNPLPVGLRGSWNLAAIRAGKHVVCYPPLAANAEEAAEVRDAAAAASVKVAEAYDYLYHPLIRRVHELVGSGELGDIQRVNTHLMTVWEQGRGPWPTDAPYRSLELAGGGLVHMGCYGLRFLRSLAPWLGEPTVVEDRVATQRSGAAPRIDEAGECVLKFPSGAEGKVDYSMDVLVGRGFDEVRMRIVGTRGQVSCSHFTAPHDAYPGLQVHPEGEYIRFEEFDTRRSSAYRHEAFTNWIRHDEPIPTDANDAVTTLQLIDDCYRIKEMEPRRRYTGPLTPPR